MKIGFIGLGIMGAPMAGHLLDAGYAVVASDHRGKPPADLLAKGLKTVSGHAAVAEAAARDLVRFSKQRLGLVESSLAPVEVRNLIHRADGLLMLGAECAAP